MSFQILDIVLYGPRGQLRRIELRPHAVNIITGASKAGKTALADIIDYCLGSSECNVAEGPIRKTVLWYGLRLALSRKRQVFVARKAPKPGLHSSAEVFYETGRTVAVPNFESLRQTTNVEAAIQLLSRAAGIAENLHEPPPGQTRLALEATIRHALYFTFQPQNEIVSRKFLFHRQDEQHIPQAIKDVLPYFLGAIDDEHLAKQHELRRLKEKLREAERRQAEIERLRGGGLNRATTLLAEAHDLGLIASGLETPKDLEEAAHKLREISNEIFAPESEDLAGGALQSLLEERARLSEALRGVREDLSAARALLGEEKGFEREAGEQVARLKSIEILPPDPEHPSCPLCQAPVAGIVPQVAEMQQSMARLTAQVETLRSDPPRLVALIDTLEQRHARTRGKLQTNRDSLDAVRAADERLSSAREHAVRRAHALGRISLYLDSLPAPTDLGALERELNDLRKQVRRLEEELSNETTAERVESILSLVGRKVTKCAKLLKLEHSQYPLRLDIRKLTLVADTPSGPIPMDKMGSAENWVGYHLSAHLALHDWFVRQKRPVPGFLFLDQPSQVYFPAERDVNDGSIDVISDEDRAAVAAMFELIFQVVARLKKRAFQVIVTEHADLREPWFRDAVVQRWRGGEKLIPVDWL